MSSISPEVTCFSSFSRRSARSFPEQRIVIECFSCAAVFSLPVLTAVPVLLPVRCFSMQASHERNYKNDRKFLSKR